MRGCSDKYVGQIAAHYEKRRIESIKWRREQEAVEDNLREISPRSVLDAPIGTGRFIGAYHELGAEYVGIDTSADMLAQAKPRGAGQLLESDLLSIEAWREFDCVVCVRFLNWIESPEPAIERFALFKPKDIVLSVTTSKQPFKKPNGLYVHRESDFCRLVERLNYRHERIVRWKIDGAHSASVRWLKRNKTQN